MKEKGVNNPQILLVVVQHFDLGRTREIGRKLVPLGQMMERLEFNRPGRHTIYTTIVWDDSGEGSFKARWLLRGNGREFEWKMFEYNDKFSRTRYDIIYKHSLDEGSLDVAVAEEFFAKEPPVWLNWWVNLWFRAMEVSQPTNQCSFRRRAILAFTVQPIPVFIWALLKSLTRLIVAVALVLCGMRSVSFKPVIHPFKLCLDNVLWNMGYSVFLRDKHGKWYFAYVADFVGRGLRTIWRALVPPPSAEELERRQQAEREQMDKISDKWIRQKREKQEREQRELETLYEGLQDIACIGVPLKPKLELLPERRRTFHLRYMDLKVRVCKLYAQKD